MARRTFNKSEHIREVYRETGLKGKKLAEELQRRNPEQYGKRKPNVLAAYVILGDHGISEGDTVTLDSGTVGTIEAIGLYSTRIRSESGSTVIVQMNRPISTISMSERRLCSQKRRVVSPVQPWRAASQPDTASSDRKRTHRI